MTGAVDLSGPARRNRIGGSEIGAVVGCHPYQDAHALWVFKRGLAEPFEPNIRMKMGIALEPGILKLYSDETGYSLTPGGHMCHHLTIPYMVFSPDALVQGERRGVDAKLVAWDQRHHWGEDEDHIPPHIQLQCHWYMIAMDYEFWDLAVVFPGLEFRRYTVERDPVFHEWILEKAEEFWRRYLIGTEEPAFGASEASRHYLQQRFPRNIAPLRSATPEEVAKLEEFGELRAAAKSIDNAKKALQRELEKAIGDADGLTWGRGKMTWKRTKDSQYVHWQALSADLLRNESAEVKTHYISLYTKTDPGYRRIHYRRDGDDEE